MCLIAFALNCHPGYPLVVVANRDEYYDRRTAGLSWWQDHHHVLAGRDLRAGGTWMGVSVEGRWAAVTNYREGQKAEAPCSRGALVADYLSGASAPWDYLQELAPRASEFGGFSLLTGTLDAAKPVLYCLSNRQQDHVEVAPGIHTLSNHLIDTPWPKSELARLKLSHHLKAEQLRVEDLVTVLAERQPFDDHELPVTGVGIELERTLSPPFIATENYGTRCTSVLLLDNLGRVVFAEQSFGQNGKKGPLALYEFEL